jgi:hypothetical protein
MSSVVLSGDTSGTVTLTVPAVAGTNTVTIAAQTGTLNAAGPAFSAYRTATQSTSAASHTKVQLNLEDFDTNNNFDSTTNYRFTPTVAGYYQVNWVIVIGTNPSGEYFSELYKNGSMWSWGNNNVTSNGNYNASTGSSLVYMNGSTDYLELYMYCASAVTISPSTSFPTRFSGFLARGA